jgi:hypothetical protein
VNISLVALSLRSGYASLAPEQLRHVSPDVVFCGAILLTMPLFALLTVHYAVRRCNVDKLRRPSLDRNPLNWFLRSACNEGNTASDATSASFRSGR